MRRTQRTLIVATALAAAAHASTCPNVLSCSPEAQPGKLDPCCGPTPAGLFVFRQRFEPDFGADSGSWGIDGVDVLDCQTQEPATQASSPAYSHEEIGSFCHRSTLFGGEAGLTQAEGAWAQSEVGEGYEEVWERSWMTSGRYISTLAPQCNKNQPAGEGPAAFFHTLHTLHGQFPTARLLADADIYPSDDTTYSLSEIVAALSFNDHRPVVSCDNATLDSVLWPLEVTGTFQTGSFQPSHLYERTHSCPGEGIVYQPTTTRPKPTEVDSWEILRRPPPRPITKTHDESKLYYSAHEREAPLKLQLFKDGDEIRGEQKEAQADRRYIRDEL